MKIFVAGSGKLANAILTSNVSIQGCTVTKWETTYQTLKEKSIIVHTGSGRQLEECLEFCLMTKSVFIELSTGSKTEKMNLDFPLIICPNASILVLKTLNMIKTNGWYFENYEISVTESHQSTKKTQPGTAYAIANSLRFSPDKIVSIRDPEIQRNQLRIPKEYLNQHAFHKIVIRDEEDIITIETKVLGYKSYVNGIKKIIESMLKNNLENKKYTVWDFIDKEMI